MTGKKRSWFTHEYGITQKELVTPCKVINTFDPKRAISTEAVWDTGAMGTVITSAAARKLNLRPVGKARVLGIKVKGDADKNIASIVDVYLVNIVLPENVAVAAISVAEAEFSSQADLLIGMDVIGLGDFCVYEGRTLYFSKTRDLPSPFQRIKKKKL